MADAPGDLPGQRRGDSQRPLGLRARRAPNGCSTVGSRRRLRQGDRCRPTARARTSQLRPVSPYAASKAAADDVAHQAWLGYGQQVVRCRPFNHLGPGQTDRFVAPALAGRVAQNERSGDDVVRVGNLSPERDFTDVRDVVRGIPADRSSVAAPARSTTSALDGRSLSRTSPNSSSRWRRSPCDSRPTLTLERPVDIPVLLGDNSRLRTDTGWEPRIALSTTLADLLDDRRRRLDES
ncbi:MAG: GDP-mannose 4,6-dehydratase [Microthrixaceae bacterium]